MGSNKRFWQLAAIAAAAMVAGCAAGPNPMVSHSAAGFWLGLWHGMICPIAFVISFFKKSVSIYEVHNNGAWYNFGFILGAGAWGVLGGSRGGKR